MKSNANKNVICARLFQFISYFLGGLKPNPCEVVVRTTVKVLNVNGWNKCHSYSAKTPTITTFT